MLLAELVEASTVVGATRSRKAKIAALAAALATATPEEVETATAYLSGVLRQRRTGLGWRSLTDLPAPADTSTLTVAEVHEAFDRIAAEGVSTRRGEKRLTGLRVSLAQPRGDESDSLA